MDYNRSEAAGSWQENQMVQNCKTRSVGTSGWNVVRKGENLLKRKNRSFYYICTTPLQLQGLLYVLQCKDLALLFLSDVRLKFTAVFSWRSFSHNVAIFKKKLGDIGPFCGATDTLVLDLWWRLLWDSKPGWIPCFAYLLPVHNGFLRFTSGGTPADLLAASMAAEPFLSTYLPNSVDVFYHVIVLWQL